MPLVIQADPLKVVSDYLAATVPTITDPAGFTFAGTRLPAKSTPNYKVIARHIGGTSDGRTHARPQVDVLVWADGSPATDAKALKMARTLHGMMQRDFLTRDVAMPVVLPDPADPSKRVALFTVEIRIRGVQS